MQMERRRFEAGQGVERVAVEADMAPDRGERLALAQGVLVADGGDDGLRKPEGAAVGGAGAGGAAEGRARLVVAQGVERGPVERDDGGDRKSTRLNSSP